VAPRSGTIGRTDRRWLWRVTTDHGADRGFPQLGPRAVGVDLLQPLVDELLRFGLVQRQADAVRLLGERLTDDRDSRVVAGVADQDSGLLICADGGGSNGYRTRMFKTELAALAATTGLRITVCHLPPGTSKWNKIEHRLFSHISMNWRGRPLTSHEVIVESIAATTTRSGLTVRAELDTATYPTGVKIPDHQMKDLENQGILTRHAFHGEWNYTLNPTARDTPEPTDVK